MTVARCTTLSEGQPFSDQPWRSENVLDMLPVYPSSESQSCPRLVWDRETDVLRAREGAKQIAAANAQ
jgi:hypothetical protein